MAPRAYWRGYLKLSLVSCPIALFPATSEREKISFHQLNKKIKAVPGRWHGKAGAECVAEVTGVAHFVSCRHRRCIGSGKGRKHRVRIGEVHAFLHQVC